MKNIKDFITESAINKKDIVNQYKELEQLDPKSEEDVDKFNVLAMDALELYWGDENFDKKVNDEIYDSYKKAFSLMISKKNNEAKELFMKVAKTAISKSK